MRFVPGKIIKKFEAKGKKITLRYPKMSDAKDLMEYLNSLVDEEARILAVKKIKLEAERKWLSGIINNMKNGKELALCVEINGKICGIAMLRKRMPSPSALDHVANLGFGIHKNYRRLGITEETIKTLINLGKKVWRLQIVTSEYASDNVASANFHKKLGFTIIGKIPKGMKYDNKYVDEVLVLKELK